MTEPPASPASAARRRSPWGNPLPWVILAGLVLRLAYLAEQQAGSVLFYQPLLDEQEMAGAARQLLAGGGFGHEPLFKAPLYPVYLAGVMALAGEGWFFLARLVQHLLGAGLVLLAYDAARRCHGAPGSARARLAGWLAAAALAFYGPLLRLEDSLILDFFAVFLQSAMLWALVRLRTCARPARETRWAALAGALAALSWLNRPTLTPVLPFLALWIAGRPAGGLWKSGTHSLRWRRRLACAGLFLAFPILAMALVYWRNAKVGGEGMVLPWQGGYSFYYANAARANGKYYLQESYALARTGNPTRELAESGWRQAVAQGQTPAAAAGGMFHAIDRYWQSRALGEMRQDPARWLGLMTRKLVYLATTREIFNFEVYEVQRQLSGILGWLPVSFGMLWPLALASVVMAGARPRRRRALGGLVWLYGGLLGGAIALYYVSGRLRMPLVFPAALLAGGALADFVLGKEPEGWKGPQGLKGRNIAAVFVMLIVGCAMSYGDWWGVRSENLRHIEYARLSNAAWRAGENQKALDYAAACERESPGYPSAALLRGQALYSLNKIDDAAGAFNESLTRQPQDPVAAYNLGIIAYYDRPDAARAAGFFAEALRRQPAYHQAAWMGALAELRLQHADRARVLLRPYLSEGGDGRLPQMMLTAEVALYLMEKNAGGARHARAQIEKFYGADGLKALDNELKLIKVIMPEKH